MRYFIGLTVPDELATAITAVRRQLGAAGAIEIATNEPHLTLIVPFETELDLASLINILTPNTDPFNLQTTAIDSFPAHTWWLGVTPRQPLQALYDKLMLKIAKHSEISFSRSDIPFNPHITIVHQLTANEYELARPQIEVLQLPEQHWTINELMLYRFDRDRWKRAASVPLRSDL